MWKLLPFLLLPFLSGCDIAVLNPKGVIAVEQRDLILISLGLMLIVVIPVILLTFVFAYKYRSSNKSAKYTPDWEHNNTLEIVWWSIPIVIIIILAVITWRTSHSLDPYKPLESSVKPVTVQVVALDWKWLFIYPDYNIASVNEVRIPVSTPINFKITAQAPMNAFWIPHLAGQIYAMEGMQTLLHIQADHVGRFEGVSANFSGEGFSGMKFDAVATSADDFARWVDSVKANPDSLTQERYDVLAKPSFNEPVKTFTPVAKGLFLGIMMKYMMPGCDMANCERTEMPKACCKRPNAPAAPQGMSSHDSSLSPEGMGSPQQPVDHSQHQHHHE